MDETLSQADLADSISGGVRHAHAVKLRRHHTIGLADMDLLIPVYRAECLEKQFLRVCLRTQIEGGCDGS